MIGERFLIILLIVVNLPIVAAFVSQQQQNVRPLPSSDHHSSKCTTTSRERCTRLNAFLDKEDGGDQYCFDVLLGPDDDSFVQKFPPKQTIQHHVNQAKQILPRGKNATFSLIEDDDDLQLCALNMENVLGIRVEDTKMMLSYYPDDITFEDWKYYLETWKDIKEESDLFLKGCGPFDAMAVYEKAIYFNRRAWIREALCYHTLNKSDFVNDLQAFKTKDQSYYTKNFLFMEQSPSKLSWEIPDSMVTHLVGKHHTIEKEKQQFCAGWLPNPELDDDGLDHDCSVMENYRLWWLVSVGELQAWAYFFDLMNRLGENGINGKYLTGILDNGKTCSIRKHILNHYHYWKNPEHAKYLDEYYFECDIEKLYFLATQHWEYETDLKEYMERPAGCENMSPDKLLKYVSSAMAYCHGIDVVYDWLDDLKDDPENGLKVLRSKIELACAQKTIKKRYSAIERFNVEEKKSIFVRLDDEESMAMGEYSLDDGGVWVYVDKHNKYLPVNEGVRAKFHNYTSQIKAWQNEKNKSVR